MDTSSRQVAGQARDHRGMDGRFRLGAAGVVARRTTMGSEDRPGRPSLRGRRWLWARHDTLR